MSQISDVLRSAEGDRLHFFCPACRVFHGIPVSTEAQSPGRWYWDGNKDKPSFSPSLAVSTYRMEPPYVFGLPKPKEQRRVDTMCHFFIRNGQFVFLDDCTHEYKGRTVDMVNLADAQPIDP